MTIHKVSGVLLCTCTTTSVPVSIPLRIDQLQEMYLESEFASDIQYANGMVEAYGQSAFSSSVDSWQAGMDIASSGFSAQLSPVSRVNFETSGHENEQCLTRNCRERI